MPAVRLDITADPDGAPFQLLTALDGVSVYLRFRWVDRSECWVLSVLSEDGAELVGSVRVVNGWDLLAPHRHDPRIPPGMLMAWAKTDADINAGKAELGGRVEIYYLEAA